MQMVIFKRFYFLRCWFNVDFNSVLKDFWNKKLVLVDGHRRILCNKKKETFLDILKTGGEVDLYLVEAQSLKQNNGKKVGLNTNPATILYEHR